MDKNRKKQYKTIINDWKDIRRHNDPIRNISRNARDILFSALHQIKKRGHAILTHEELTEITEVQHDQNCNLVKQLGFILNAEFFRSIVENSKKYRDGYKFTLTQNAEEILQNPKEYFANIFSKNNHTSPNFFCDIAEENQGSFDPLNIYKKKEIKNDINDNQENQFLNSNFFSTKNTDFVEANVKRLAEESSKVEIVHSTQIIDIVQIEAKPQKQAVIHQFNLLKDRVYITDKNGNSYWGMPLMKFRYSRAMLEQIRVDCKKPHFTHERIVGLFRYMAEKYPDKLIFGGRKGFISYMRKVVNGELEYTKEERLKSIEDTRRKAREALELRLANGNQIQWA